MRCRGLDRTRAGIALSLLWLCAPVATMAGIHRIEVSGQLVPTAVPLAESVQDPFFGFLLGVLDADLYGEVEAADLDSIINAAGGSKMPVDVVRRMTREMLAAPGDAPGSIVRIEFHAPLDVPIPYSILGYNPGSLRASREMVLLHWIVGDERFEFANNDEKDRVVEVRDGHLFMFGEGSMEMDIDGWLDRLMRGKLDDVTLSGFFVFRDGDDRVGLGFGYSNKKRGRTGAFDFRENESIFPASKAYLSLGRTLRERGERLVSAFRNGSPVPGSISREDTTHR